MADRADQGVGAEQREPRRSMLVGALSGAALMAAGDEIVFHQISHWHHFYDRSTSGVGHARADHRAPCAGSR